MKVKVDTLKNFLRTGVTTYAEVRIIHKRHKLDTF